LARSWAALSATTFLALCITACGGAVDVGNTPSLSTNASSNTDSLPTGAYRRRADGKIVVAGHPVPIKSKSVTGYIDNVTSDDKQISLTGWTARANLSAPAEAVVAFVGKKAMASLKPAGDRPDVAQGYDKPGLEQSGFVLGIPMRSLNCSIPRRELVVFGIADGKATPLAWLGDTRQHADSKCKGDNASP
jgi:hypothetical protein